MLQIDCLHLSCCESESNTAHQLLRAAPLRPSHALDAAVSTGSPSARLLLVVSPSGCKQRETRSCSPRLIHSHLQTAHRVLSNAPLQLLLQVRSNSGASRITSAPSRRRLMSNCFLVCATCTAAHPFRSSISTQRFCHVPVERAGQHMHYSATATAAQMREALNYSVECRAAAVFPFSLLLSFYAQMADIRRNGCQLYQEQLLSKKADGSPKWTGVTDETSACIVCCVPGQSDVLVAQHPHQPATAAVAAPAAGQLTLQKRRCKRSCVTRSHSLLAALCLSLSLSLPHLVLR